MSGKTILVLGGGIGGLVAANELRRKLPRAHRVVMIEKNALHAFAPSFLWLMTGDRKPEQIARPLQKLVRHGVEIVQAEVHQINLSTRSVRTHIGEMAYDSLIIALGAEPAYETMPGLNDAAHTFYTFDGAIKLRDALPSFKGRTIAIVVSALPYKCPGAPYEGAMLIADFFRKRGRQNKVSVHLLTPESQPLPVAGPVLGAAVKQMLEEKGIVYHPLHQLTAVDSDSHELSFNDKEPFKYDLLIAIPPHLSPAVVRESDLANERGWVSVDSKTLETKYERVYAVGDVAAIPIPGRWKSDVRLTLPKAGVFAHAQAQVVARRVIGEITGVPVSDVFCGDGYCMLEAGEDMAGFAYGNFFAEPSPQVELRRVGRIWHFGKVLFENWWLAPYGIRREAYRLALTMGAKTIGLPGSF
jgi:sulfide:quinone oxidoreductase